MYALGSQLCARSAYALLNSDRLPVHVPRLSSSPLRGLDGSGKTTQLERLAKLPALREGYPGNHPPAARRRPSSATVIRSLLLDSRNPKTALGPIAPRTPSSPLCLPIAPRPSPRSSSPPLAAGHIVLCDRFTDSSEAYQGGRARSSASSAVLDAPHIAVCGNLQPDLTLLLLPLRLPVSLRSRPQSQRRGTSAQRGYRRGIALNASPISSITRVFARLSRKSLDASPRTHPRRYKATTPRVDAHQQPSCGTAVDSAAFPAG